MAAEKKPRRHRYVAYDLDGAVAVVVERPTRQLAHDKCIEDCRTMVALKQAAGPITNWTFKHEEID